MTAPQAIQIAYLERRIVAAVMAAATCADHEQRQTHILAAMALARKLNQLQHPAPAAP